MTQLTLVKGGQANLAKVNLFGDGGSAGAQARKLREREQRKRMEKLARELTQMLDRLDEEVRADPERAAGSVAEYVGLLEKSMEEVCEIRDLDEEFGSRGSRRRPIAAMAERLEKGLNYLVGVFSVVATSKNVGRYNWKLVERDIQEVLAMSRAIGCDEAERPIKQAA